MQAQYHFHAIENSVWKILYSTCNNFIGCGPSAARPRKCKSCEVEWLFGEVKRYEDKVIGVSYPPSTNQ